MIPEKLGSDSESQTTLMTTTSLESTPTTEAQTTAAHLKPGQPLAAANPRPVSVLAATRHSIRSLDSPEKLQAIFA